MIQDHKTRSLEPFNFSTIREHIPELKQLNCHIEFYAFHKPIDSSNVQPDFWTELTTVIEKKYNSYDGFVILHGTDTMAYTASALSFMLENLSKPIILTGSQLPLGVIRTDAKRNLITTIEIAAAKTVVPEVCIYFSNQLFRGNRAEKFTSSKFDAFQSPNYPALAEAGTEIRFNKNAIHKNSTGKFKVYHHGFDINIAVVRVYPGLSKATLESTLATKGLKAVVLETYGSGNAPTNSWFISSLEKAITRGVVILNVSQCSGGIVEQGKYETSFHLKKIGVISGGDVTREAAVCKLMFLLGKGLSKKQIGKYLTANMKGEMS
jgi:L-asparaginase